MTLVKNIYFYEMKKRSCIVCNSVCCVKRKKNVFFALN